MRDDARCPSLFSVLTIGGTRARVEIQQRNRRIIASEGRLGLHRSHHHALVETVEGWVRLSDIERETEQ